ncbi:MAG: HypC/HybG/HupF family hydrogenase formation chaperone [Lachnospiraceae bacterium]|nr:HypC/HybG/HupF family hydrogenase formation chaperone [Lachnospiraceae bacterium]
MCVAYPGIVEKIEGRSALVNFSGNIVRAASGFVAPQVGDRVLVHAGYIMQKVSKSEAEELQELFDELEQTVADKDRMKTNGSDDSGRRSDESEQERTTANEDE